MGFDWNGDGKHDLQDDAFFHAVIDQDNKEKPRPSERNNRPNVNKTNDSTQKLNGGTVINLLSIIYIGLLLPGDLGINWFTMMIGLACVIRLGYSFLKWLYK